MAVVKWWGGENGKVVLETTVMNATATGCFSVAGPPLLASTCAAYIVFETRDDAPFHVSP